MATPRPLPPWARTHLKITGVAALGLGFALIFLPPTTILYNPFTFFISHHILQRPLPPTSLHANLDNLGQALALSGIFSYAIGVAYCVAFFHGHEEWLYMGIPAKLAISAMALLVWVLRPERMSPLLFALCAVDGITALVLGWTVGTFSGRVPEGYRSGRKDL